MSASLYRTYSSPNFKDSKKFAQTSTVNFLEEDQEFYVIGDRVLLDHFKPASVAYFGEVEFASGDWVGLVLDEASGQHDGKLHGRKYFQCEPMHGLFVRPHRLTRVSTYDLDEFYDTHSSGRNSASTPRQRLFSKSPGSSSLLDTYIYDDDYKREKVLPSLGPRNYSDTCSAGGGILKREQPFNSRLDELMRRAESTNREAKFNKPVYSFRPSRLGQLRRTNALESTSSPMNRSLSSVDLSTKPLNTGDRVLIRLDRGECSGTLRYLGETEFATGEWAGVELDQAEGKNDGSVLGVRYFYCNKNYGLFVPISRVKLASPNSYSPAAFKSVRNTLGSPPPAQTIKSSPTSRTNRSNNYLFRSSNDLSPSYDSGNISNSSTNPSSPITSKLLCENFDTNYSRHNSLWPSFEGGRNKSKFDDIEQRLNKFLPRSTTPISTIFDNSSLPSAGLRGRANETYENVRGTSSKAKSKCIEYTFKSSKYDGNPVAKRTVLYD